MAFFKNPKFVIFSENTNFTKTFFRLNVCHFRSKYAKTDFKYVLQCLK